MRAEAERKKNSDKTLSLIPITKGTNGPLDYAFDLKNSTVLAGAHGEEIVRHLFIDMHVRNASFFPPPFYLQTSYIYLIR